ncbi:MAG: small subunit ribosomal protein S2 [Parvicellaceae bacterium]|jgi:small subunit ribosomal protein S2
MAKANFQELLDAGVHFGHLKRKWNPNMAPYIFDEKKGIHVIDLNKTIVKANESAAALKQIAMSGKKILFVATKKQAKDIVSKLVEEVNMPYVVERWTGGMLTNFGTTRKSVRKMHAIDKMEQDGTMKTLSKRERLMLARKREKMNKVLGSVSEMTRLPAAIFVVDIRKEHIAVKEATKLGIPIFAMVDTNSDPREVDFAIPSNDDATKSISKIVGMMTEAVKEGLEDRKSSKAKSDAAKAKSDAKAAAPKAAAPKAAAAAAAAAPKEEAPKDAAPEAK